MPTVNHFDIPVDDVIRAQNFYSKVFGWDMKKVVSMVDSNIELWMCETQDEKGIKGISGGFMKRNILPTVTNYIGVTSIDKYLPKINSSGGKITVPKTEIPGIGFFSMFFDSEKNLFGLFEEKSK